MNDRECLLEYEMGGFKSLRLLDCGLLKTMGAVGLRMAKR